MFVWLLSKFLNLQEMIFRRSGNSGNEVGTKWERNKALKNKAFNNIVPTFPLENVVFSYK
jgi:hypothetical protein